LLRASKYLTLRSARKKREMLNAAGKLSDLHYPPRNRLEALNHDREGQHSIRMTRPAPHLFRVDGCRGATRRDRRPSLIRGERGLRAENDALGRNGRRSTMRLPRNRPPTHPGEILLEEFLVPLDMTQTQVAEGRRVAAATPCPHPARV
jgi:hypothetical protein